MAKALNSVLLSNHIMNNKTKFVSTWLEVIMGCGRGLLGNAMTTQKLHKIERLGLAALAFFHAQ